MSIDSLRDSWNREALQSHRLDAVVCRLPENVLLLTGYWPISGAAIAVFPVEGRTWLFVLDTEREMVPADTVDEIRSYSLGMITSPDPFDSIESLLRGALRASDLEHGTIGIEYGFESVAPGFFAGEVLVPAGKTFATISRAAPDAALVDATEALYIARSRKTPSEIEKLRRANSVAAFGLAAFIESFEPGRTEAEVSAAVEGAIMSKGIGYDGAAHARGWAQLMTGPESARAFSFHPATSARKIEKGDLGVLELGTVVDGYWSDLTRTRVAGASPDGRQSEMHDVLTSAISAVMRGARPDMTGAQIDSLARDEIRGAGYGDLFVHHLGHGLGFRYHEAIPLLNPTNTGIITESMVTSVEPGVYIDGFGGMRLEDNIAFTVEGIDNLSPFPTDLTGPWRL